MFRLPRTLLLRLALATALVVPSVSSAIETDPGGVARTADGRPDLDGVWDFSTLVPLERPEEMGNRITLTEEEAAELETEAQVSAKRLWAERVTLLGADRRTSLIIDPPDGRLPPIRPGAKVQEPGDDLPADLPVRIRVGGIGTDGPENRGLSERCLIGFNAGPPLTPGHYNQHVRIVQTRDHVVLQTEMIHEARIVPLTRHSALPEGIRPWMGDSQGRWEGDTLVIETTRFKEEVGSFSPTVFSAVGSAREMRVVERLSRLDVDTLRYEFTVDDPATYTRPFTAVLLMKRTDQRIFEYACHEGNHPLRHILETARTLEREPQ
jgi:hypothetical protein